MLEIMKIKKTFRNFRSFKKYKKTLIFCTFMLRVIEEGKINKILYHIITYTQSI